MPARRATHDSSPVLLELFPCELPQGPQLAPELLSIAVIGNGGGEIARGRDLYLCVIGDFMNFPRILSKLLAGAG